MSARGSFRAKASSKEKRASPHHAKFAPGRKSDRTAVKDFKTEVEALFVSPPFYSTDSDSSSDNKFPLDNSPTYRLSFDEDIELLYDFYEEEALKELLNITPSLKLVLSNEIQDKIEPNEAPNCPWKEIAKEIIQDCFPEVVNDLEGEKLLLVAYPPSLSKEVGTFSLFDDVEKANRASELLKRLETFNGRKLRPAYSSAQFHNTK